MKYREIEWQLRRELARLTNTKAKNWHLVFKARYGMETALKTLADELGAGDILTQAFTCITAVDPIIVAGHRPVYADVTRDNMAIDVQKIKPTKKTRAFILQHTFGIVSGAEDFRNLANQRNWILIEDSAHCVAKMARDQSGKPLADISVHSFGVEKILNTRFGGAIWLNPEMKNAKLFRKLSDNFANLPRANCWTNLKVRLYRPTLAILNRLPRKISQILRKVLLFVRVFEPPIAPVELRGRLPYKSTKPSKWIICQVLRALENDKLDQNYQRRQLIVKTYSNALKNCKEISFPREIAQNPQPLVRFPIFAQNAAAAERIFTKLNQNKIAAGKWYRPLLFPGTDQPEIFNFNPNDESQEAARKLSQTAVNLPTNISVAQAKHIAELVEKFSKTSIS